MDAARVLAAFDDQLRRQAPPEEPGRTHETDEHVTRSVPVGEGWTAVVWTDLDETNADALIAEQVARFAGLGRRWEWKYYTYDGPADLPDRLVAAGFVPEPVETLLVAEIAGLPLDVPPPAGIELVDVTDAAGVADLVAVHDEVFGDDNSELGRALLPRLGRQPATVAAAVAYAGTTPVAAGRVEFHHGTEFASIWGGGTVPAWERRGVFRALVAYRAAQAASQGFRYLQVDATDESRPILERLGFVPLAQTTPFIWSPPEDDGIPVGARG
jgi:hypothetical protein